MTIDRRTFMAWAALAGGAPSLAMAQPAAKLSLMTAGAGSAFLPYGQGIAKLVNASGAAAIEVVESKGSIENLMAVEKDAATLGTAFLGSAYDAIGGTGFAAGHKHTNVRALFPMYETAFMAATLDGSKLTRIADLDGKRVGCGPAAGPAEGYFRAMAEIANIKPVILSGSPAEQGKQLLAGEIDAFWQGASVPIPSLTTVANQAAVRVFGLSDAEVASALARFPFMAEAIVAPGTYKGQADLVKSVAAWNVVVAHKDLPDAVALAVTRAVLDAPDLAAVLGAAAKGTSARNAKANAVVPWHPGVAKLMA